MLYPTQNWARLRMAHIHPRTARCKHSIPCNFHWRKWPHISACCTHLYFPKFMWLLTVTLFSFFFFYSSFFFFVIFFLLLIQIIVTKWGPRHVLLYSITVNQTYFWFNKLCFDSVLNSPWRNCLKILLSVVKKWNVNVGMNLLLSFSLVIWWFMFGNDVIEFGMYDLTWGDAVWLTGCKIP